MAFEVRGSAPALREGDRIVATLAVTQSRSWLEDVSLAGSTGRVSSSGPAAGQRAAAGAIVPDFELIDQSGRPFRMRDLAGRVAVLTFIYTRCPLPDFCPLMVRQLESVRRRANEAGIGRHLALVGVTLDPTFDTPAVLEAYGESMLKGANRFDQWTLVTGTPTQIETVAAYFGIGYKSDAGFITHNLVTAVVAADGRVMQVFPSNSWLPEAIFERVRQGVDRAAVQ